MQVICFRENKLKNKRFISNLNMQESVVEYTIDSDKEQLQAVILAAREVEEYYKRTPPFMWSTCYKHGLPEENLLIDTNLDEVSDPSRQNFLTSTEEISICRVVENPRRGADDRYPRIRATARFLALAILDHVKQKFTFNFEKDDKTLLRKAVHVITAMEKRKRLKIIRKLIYRRRKATTYLMALRKKVKHTTTLLTSPSNRSDIRTRQAFMTSTPKSHVSDSNLFSLNISPCKRRRIEADDKLTSKRRRQHENVMPSMTPRRLDISFPSYTEETGCFSNFTGFNPGQQLSPSASAVAINRDDSIQDRPEEFGIQTETTAQTGFSRNGVTWLRNIADETTTEDMSRLDNTNWLFNWDSCAPVEVLTSFEPSNPCRGMSEDQGELSTNTPNTATLSDSLVDDSMVLNYNSALPHRLSDVNTVQLQANNKCTNTTKISEGLADFKLDFSTKHDPSNAKELLAKFAEFKTVTESSCSITREDNLSSVGLTANHDPTFLHFAT